MNQFKLMKSVIICLVVIIVLIILLWIFIGGGDYEFEGLKFLAQPECMEEYIKDQVEPTTIVKPMITIDPASIERPTVTERPTVSITSSFADKICVNKRTFKNNNYTETNVPLGKDNITPNIPKVLRPGSFYLTNDGRKFASKGEAISCRSLEKIYNKKFTKIRPNWLKNPKTGRNLELDGFNEELMIAFEYNGRQHYVKNKHWHKKPGSFEEQLWRDEFKLNKCDDEGVYLITIPYNVPFDDIPAFIEYYLPEKVQNRRKLGIE